MPALNATDMPMKIRTHYDNLKVSRDAPPEVIRAAYKSLTQKYHPDRNPDPQAAKIMLHLNEAYEVLSDPEKRDNHDKWIRFEEWKAAHRVDPKKEQPQPQPQASASSDKWREKKPVEPTSSKKQPFQWSRTILPLLILLGWGYTLTPTDMKNKIAGYWDHFLDYNNSKSTTENSKTTKTSPSQQAYNLTPEESKKLLTQTNTKPTGNTGTQAPTVKAPTKPTTPTMCSPEMTKAPNGQAWPARAAYVGPITRANGYSTITIDNGKGNSNIYIKLARPTDGKSSGIREAYIPAGSTFKMNKIEPGNYVIKYKDIKNGCNSKSDPFDVEQIQTAQGIQYSDISLTIYTMLNGNMDFERLPENAF